MNRASSCPARLCALLATLALVVLSFGLAAPASADGSDVDRGNSEAAHQKNAERKSESRSAATTHAAATTGGDDVAASHPTRGTGGTSGETTQEQPVSNADRNSGGANGQCSDTEPDAGPYCSTRDGKASGNGQGVGKATGKPCAGCVGKADNKNPPGQLPGPQDRNNGYECDNNNGIGKGKANSKDGATSAGNPAHTGCEAPPTVSEECPPGSTASECVEEEECPPGSQKAECVEGESPPPGDENPPPGSEGNPNPPVIAGAEEFGAPRPPAVAGVQQFAGPAPAAAPLAAAPQAAAPEAGVLPATGAAALAGALTALGFGLLLLGGLLLGMRRRSIAAARR